jgi:hypothetical protein
MFTDDELITKKDIFDPIEDDDDIDWKYNPFDLDSIYGTEETPDQLMSQITFEGSPQLPRLFQVRLVFPLRFLVSETSHTSVYFVYPHHLRVTLIISVCSITV